MLARLKLKIDPLVEEMLNMLPDDVIINGKILDPGMGGGQFLKEIERRKKDSGKSVQEIKKTVYGIEKDKLSVNYAVNNKKLVGTYKQGNFLDNMDKLEPTVILGNPPYNDIMGDSRSESKNTNNSNLYFDFILKSIELKPKFISFIVPASWMNNDSIRQKVLDAGLKKVKEIDPSYFPNVGIRSGISMLHIESGYQGKIEVESLTSAFEIDRDSVLSFDNPKKFTVIKKLKNSKMFDSLLSYGPYKIPKGSKGSIERLIELDPNFSEVKTKSHTTSVMIYAGGSMTDARYLYHTNSITSQKWGVVVPSASDKYIIGAVRVLQPGIGVSDRLKVAYFNSKHEAENVKQFLESKLISFVIRTTKHNDTVNTNKNSFGNIPIIDFTKPLDDKNILKLFNITEEELDAIN